MGNSFIALADIHAFQMKNQARSYTDGISDRLADVGYTLDRVGDYAWNNNIKNLFVLGDVFHNKGVLSVTVYNYMYKKFKELSSCFDKITILAGNHDQARGTMHDVSIYGLSELATIVTYPSHEYIAGSEFFYLPYGSLDSATISSVFPEADASTRPRILMGHLGINGARYSGFETRATGEISLKDLNSDSFDLVLLGHFHEHQKLSPKAYYVGAPMQHDYSDEGSDRGFVVVHTNESRRGHSVDVTFVPIAGTPRFHTFTSEEYAQAQVRERDFIRLKGITRSELLLLSDKDSRITGVKEAVVEQTQPKSSLVLGDSLENILSQYIKYSDIDSDVALEKLGLQLLKDSGATSANYSKNSFKFNLSCSGFKAIGEEEVSLDFGREGLTLIQGKNNSSSERGSNGSGKSTLFEALVFGLFGKTGRVLVSDLINLECETASVVIETSRSDGAVMKVHRVLNKGSKSNELSVVISQGGREETLGGNASVIQEGIEDFLGLSKETFMLALYCVNTIGDMTPAKLSSVFEEILDLDIYSKAASLAKNQHKEVYNEISLAKNKIAANLARQNDLEEDILELENSRERVSSDIPVCYPPELLGDIRQGIEELTKRIDSEELALEERELQAKEVASEASIKYEELKQLESELNVLNNSIKWSRKLLDESNQLIAGGQCPVCGADTNTPTLNTKVSEEESKLEELSASCSKKLEKIDRVSSEEANLKAKLNTLLEECNRIKLSINLKTDKLNELKRDLSMLESEVEYSKKLKETITARVNEIDSSILAKEDKLIQLDSEAEEIQSKVTDELEPLLLSLEFWVTGFGSSGIPNLLVDSALPELNRIAKVYSDILTNGEILVSFSSSTETTSGETRNKLTIEVDDLYGYTTYDNASSGEKRRIDIILSLALQRFISLRQNLGVILLDEIFTKLDNEGEKSVLRLLRHMLGAIPSIFVISNKDTILNDHFDNIITIVREGHQSHLLEEEQ